jgi:hypothetical protein
LVIYCTVSIDEATERECTQPAADEGQLVFEYATLRR